MKHIFFILQSDLELAPGSFHLIVSGFKLCRAQIFEGTAIDLGVSTGVFSPVTGLLVRMIVISWSYLEGEQIRANEPEAKDDF